MYNPSVGSSPPKLHRTQGGKRLSMLTKFDCTQLQSGTGGDLTATLPRGQPGSSSVSMLTREALKAVIHASNKAKATNIELKLVLYYVF